MAWLSDALFTLHLSYCVPVIIILVECVEYDIFRSILIENDATIKHIFHNVSKICVFSTLSGCS